MHLNIFYRFWTIFTVHLSLKFFLDISIYGTSSEIQKKLRGGNFNIIFQSKGNILYCTTNDNVIFFENFWDLRQLAPDSSMALPLP